MLTNGNGHPPADHTAWLIDRKLLWAAAFVILLALVSIPRKPSYPDYEPGSRAHAAITMPAAIEVIDQADLASQQSTARSLAPRTWLLDLTVGKKLAAEIDAELAETGVAIPPADGLSAAERQRQRDAIVRLGEAILARGVVATRKELALLAEARHLELIRRTADGEAPTISTVTAMPPVLVGDDSPAVIQALAAREGLRDPALVAALLARHLPANLFFNAADTRKHGDDAAAAVTPRRRHFPEGTVLVEADAILTPLQVQVIRELRHLQPQLDLVTTVGHLGFFALLATLFLMFTARFFPRYYADGRCLLLLGILFAVPIVVCKAVQLFTTLSENAIYLLPVAAGSALAAILLHPRMAVFFAAFSAATVAFLGGLSFLPFLVHWTAGLAAVFAAAGIRRRTGILRAGLLAAITMAVMLLLGHMGWEAAGSKEGLLQALSYAILNGIFIIPVTVIGLLVFFEDVFHRTTNFKLLELSDQGNPLLKEMLFKAGGTYQHSLTVGNLAEKAADEIGANPLLARVGAYYHDIGKMTKPEYFSENQNYMEQNRHSDLKPSLSASILKAHVKAGVELAREHHLPPIITEIIPQHHGTSVMQYFYHQALEQAGDEPVNREDFQYPGPRPQTREAAIVMLADSAEAASRTMKNPTPLNIEELVKKLVNGKFMEGELDECDLTLRDLKKIVESFTRVLTSMYHARVEYPEEQEIREKEDERKTRQQKGD